MLQSFKFLQTISHIHPTIVATADESAPPDFANVKTNQFLNMKKLCLQYSKANQKYISEMVHELISSCLGEQKGIK